jgi:hypothetical protein
MTPEDLYMIEIRWMASTRGEWVYREGHNPESPDPYDREGSLHGPTHVPIPDTITYEPADARFIAAAHQDIPALIAEIRRLWGRDVPTRDHLSAGAKHQGLSALSCPPG